LFLLIYSENNPKLLLKKIKWLKKSKISMITDFCNGSIS
jgi:hypothetical protein